MERDLAYMAMSFAGRGKNVASVAIGRRRERERGVKEKAGVNTRRKGERENFCFFLGLPSLLHSGKFA